LYLSQTVAMCRSLDTESEQEDLFNIFSSVNFVHSENCLTNRCPIVCSQSKATHSSHPNTSRNIKNRLLTWVDFETQNDVTETTTKKEFDDQKILNELSFGLVLLLLLPSFQGIGQKRKLWACMKTGVQKRDWVKNQQYNGQEYDR